MINFKEGKLNKLTRHFFTATAGLAMAGMSVTGAFAERPYYNDKKVPNAEDLVAIQKSLQDNLAQARAATVCIQLGQGSGSGAIVSEDGLILTAAHVSSGVGKEMTVVMEDGTKHKAISLGLDSETDAAMIQITDEGKYPFVKIDDGKTMNESSTLLGDWVFSLGHSGGFDEARGSVVRLGRLVRIAGNTIQSDCKLIGGDSGGPLFDMNGVLVGIHSRVGAVLDVNMHVPMHTFHANWDAMKKKEFIGEGAFAKKPVKGNAFIGVALEKVTEGLKVTEIEEKSAASKAGIKVGDIIVSADGEKQAEKADLVKIMKTKSDGDALMLEILSGGEKKEVKLQLGLR